MSSECTLAWGSRLYFINPSSLTLLVASYLPSVSLVFGNNLKNFTLMENRFFLLPGQSIWGSGTLGWV